MILALVSPTLASTDAGSVPGGIRTMEVGADAVVPMTAQDLGQGETLIIHQPTATSTVRLLFPTGDAARIGGNLRANGNVVIDCPSGLQLGEGAELTAASLEVRAPRGLIENQGRILSRTGDVALAADDVIQSGRIEVHPQERPSAGIRIHAERALRLDADSILQAAGGPEEPSHGGTVELVSNGDYLDVAGGVIDVRGGAKGGDGGKVKICGRHMNHIRSRILGEAVSGGKGGDLFIDPATILIGMSGDGSAGSGVVGAGDPPVEGTLRLDVNSAFVGFASIQLQATQDIRISAGTVWDLAASTGVQDPGGVLLLEAGRDIVLERGVQISGSANWSVLLKAGRNFATPDAVTPGAGSILLLEDAVLETTRGHVELLAGNNITVNRGAVRTLDGGAITATAVDGNIQTGNRANGFNFHPNGYEVNPDLGGISTRNGGDVTLKAGKNVTSFLPVPGQVQSDAGSGAFGPQAGNVSVIAGQDVAGHFVVRNGSGHIQAGRDAGTAPRLLALSLVVGHWMVEAGRDVLLQEVRNPNGILNNLGSSTAPFRHAFDYSMYAGVSLTGVRSVQLLGTSLPRYPDSFSQGMGPIYPGWLRIVTGAGGVTVRGDVILFPSPQGTLEVITTDGGGLTGATPDGQASLIVSDSDRTRYRSYGDFGIDDHASPGTGPLHLGDPTAVTLSISGSVRNLLLGAPKVAKVIVGGDLINSGFRGQNLKTEDVTSIEVAGDILNRSALTRVPLGERPDWRVFDLVYPPLDADAATLPSQLSYDEASRMVVFNGRMTGAQRDALLQLRVKVFDETGQVVIQPDGEPLTRAVEVLPPETIQQLFAASQDVPLWPNVGYHLGGGGRFQIFARNLDLGLTTGIASYGPRVNPALARIFDQGAEIHIALSGYLDLFSSAIFSSSGGNITVVSDGPVRVGSEFHRTGDSFPRGIFTAGNSSVTVIARGDIDLDGSRVATFDGGSVLVRSLEGHVDVGSDRNGSTTVEKILVDPVTREIRTFAPTIPGSGILAMTFPPSLDPAFPLPRSTPGDIKVETPKGDILARGGVILQLPLGGSGFESGTVTLRAGSVLGGNVLFPGDIHLDFPGVIGANVIIEATGNVTGTINGGTLGASVNETNITTMAGAGPVLLSVEPVGLPPYSIQWYRSGVLLEGETGLVLALSPTRRADSATYQVVVRNPWNSVTNEVSVRVLVPQRISTPTLQPSGEFRIPFRDADGSPMIESNAAMSLETSTNLVDWSPLALPVQADGQGDLFFLDPASTLERPARFYRILER
ncbi:MAG: hypothetical protein JNL10_01820 [Verrucomicrobiales bacterium]|nr:hypothetical protein [Verrucomicrobiales bacterium]